MTGDDNDDRDNDRLLAAKEVAALIGRSYSALAKDRMRGVGLPYVKIGRSVRYSWPDIRRYLAEARVETKPCARKSQPGQDT